MGSETLNSYSSTGITLTAGGAYNSPFTVTTTGTISTGGSYGVDSTLASPYLLNEGSITAGNYGVGLLEGGTVTNSGAAALIHGGRYGVVFKNAAGTLTNAGTISGAAYAGVYVGIGGTVTNTASYSVIYGAVFGVKAENAAADVINAGTIIGAGRAGIYLRNGGTVTNTGVISGAGEGVDSFSYPGTISNAGTIVGIKFGGVYMHSGTLTNSGRSALISGGNAGVYAGTGADIINTGTILSTATVSKIYKPSGVELSSGTVANTASYSFIFGGEFGVDARGGAATITNAGTITGASADGVYLLDGGTVTNSGTIAGGVDAVYVKTKTFTLNALAGGVFDGAVLDKAGGGVLNLAGATAGTLNMGGSFSGFSNINFGPAAWTLDGTSSELANSQTITGFTLGDKIDLTDFAATSASYVTGTGLVLSNASASETLHFSGGNGEIAITADGSGGTSIIFGTHTLSTYTATGITLSAFGPDLAPFTVTATGTVNTGGSYGVYSTLASPFLLNEGSIAAGKYGVDLLGGGTVTNSGTTALIHGGRYGVVFKNAAGTLTNAGTISGAAYAGVFFSSGGTVTNTASYSVINGYLDGVRALNAAADVINAGTITGAGRTGIYLRNGGNVTNTGVISGGADGVDSFSYPGTISNAGTIAGGTNGVVVGEGPVTNSGRSALISGGNVGVYTGTGADIINTGTILSTSTVSGIFKPSGIKLYDGTVANTASYSLIFGGEFGVDARGGAATISNAGTIIGNTGVGVYLTHGGTITNTATGALIDGGQSGVKAKFGSTTITNAGTITGASADGVYLQDGGTVTNSGTIAGGVDAVYVKTKTFTLNALAGGVFDGAVLDSAGGGVLNLAGATAGTLNMGGSFSGFSNINFGPAAWTLDGTSSELANNQTITGFTLGDKIDLTDFAATSASYTTGTGLVLSNASASETLHFTGGNGQIGILADGSGGTSIIFATHTLSTYTATGITLSAFGPDLAPFTVTTTGTVNTGGSYGVYSTLESPFLLNEGSITAGNYGVGLLEGGTVTNSGATALIYGGRYGVVFKNAAGTLINDGTIKSSAGLEFSAGVYVGIGGTVTNTASYSVIYGHLDGVHAVNAAADVINAGTIIAAYRTGIYLRKGGNVTNTGVISGRGAGVDNFGYLGNVSNTGTILGGVYIGDGTITNSGRSALIRGDTTGAAAGSGVINTGTIMCVDAESDIFKPTGVALYGGTLANAASYSFIFGGEFGVKITGDDATIGNAGTIIGNTGIGVYLFHGGGSITNTAGALIHGGQHGVEAKLFPSTIINAGTIIGASMDGVYLQAGGAVTNNGAASVISGGIGGVLAKATATVANAGTITGGRYGVIAHKLATVSNTGRITGTTQYGVYLGAGGTITNSGTIAGANAAVLIKGAGDDLVSAQDGATFIGIVEALGTGNTLEFSGAGSTIATIGTQFTGFQTLQFDAGSNWEAAGSQAIFSATTIDGFFVNDTLDITDLFVVMPEILTLGANDVLTITQGDMTLDLTFSSVEAGAHFTIANDGGQGALITDDVLPCFCAGTRIRTPRGEVAVEDLAVGDEIITSTSQQRIKWIGQRSLDPSRHPRPDKVRPIRFEAGCIAENMPARDLFLSPDHALYLDGILVPAKTLLNGASIRQIAVPFVTYYHIELNEHTVIFAENTPAESYLETGNRGAFENGGGAITLHPDFAQTAREQKSCAPFIEAGPQVEAIRRRILDRAPIATTPDPAISIAYANGAAIIQSRDAVPGFITEDPRDRRRLGVKIAGITIAGREIPFDHPALVEGWHDAEPDGRWTDGNAIIPAALLGDARDVTVTLAATLDYPIAA